MKVFYIKLSVDLDVKVENDMADERVRPGILLSRALWGKIKILAWEKNVKAEVVVDQFLTEGLKKEGS